MHARLAGSIALALLASDCHAKPTQSTTSGAAPSAPASRAPASSEFRPIPVAEPDDPRPVSAIIADSAAGTQPLQVTTGDLTLTPVHGPPRSFSYESWAEWTFRRELGSPPAAAPDSVGCMREIEVTPISWVVPLLGVREQIYETCAREAHPGGETRFTTLAIDLGRRSLKSPRKVVLTDLFDERDIREALRRDPVVAKALVGVEAPADLDGLVRTLSETPSVLEGKHCYSFPADLLARFVLHHREGSRLAVRIGLPGAGPCRYDFTELGLLLPMPRAFSDTFWQRFGPNSASFFAAERKAPEPTALVRVFAAAPP